MTVMRIKFELKALVYPNYARISRNTMFVVANGSTPSGVRNVYLAT